MIVKLELPQPSEAWLSLRTRPKRLPRWPETNKLVLVGVAANLSPVSEVVDVVAFTEPADVDTWLTTVTSEITLFFHVLRADIREVMPSFE